MEVQKFLQRQKNMENGKQQMELLREQDVFKISADEKKNNKLPRTHLLVAPNFKSISAVSNMTAEQSVVQHSEI